MTSSDEQSLLRRAASEWRERKLDIIAAWMEQGEPRTINWLVKPEPVAISFRHTPDETAFDVDANRITYHIWRWADDFGNRYLEAAMSLPSKVGRRYSLSSHMTYRAAGLEILK